VAAFQHWQAILLYRLRDISDQSRVEPRITPITGSPACNRHPFEVIEERLEKGELEGASEWICPGDNALSWAV
jgi:hypothetical protein